VGLENTIQQGTFSMIQMNFIFNHLLLMSTSNTFMRLHNSSILIGQPIFWLDLTSGPKKVEQCHQTVLARAQLGMKLQCGFGGFPSMPYESDQLLAKLKSIVNYTHTLTSKVQLLASDHSQQQFAPVYLKYFVDSMKCWHIPSSLAPMKYNPLALVCHVL